MYRAINNLDNFGRVLTGAENFFNQDGQGDGGLSLDGLDCMALSQLHEQARNSYDAAMAHAAANPDIQYIMAPGTAEKATMNTIMSKMVNMGCQINVQNKPSIVSMPPVYATSGPDVMPESTTTGQTLPTGAGAPGSTGNNAPCGCGCKDCGGKTNEILNDVGSAGKGLGNAVFNTGKDVMDAISGILRDIGQAVGIIGPDKTAAKMPAQSVNYANASGNGGASRGGSAMRTVGGDSQVSTDARAASIRNNHHVGYHNGDRGTMGIR